MNRKLYKSHSSLLVIALLAPVFTLPEEEAQDPLLPKVRQINPPLQESEGLEVLLRKVRAFLLNHAKIDITNQFTTTIRQKIVLCEFSRICKEGVERSGLVIDLYVAVVYLLGFHIMSQRLYEMKDEYAQHLIKVVLYILKNEAEISKRYTCCSSLHTKIAEFCQPAESRLHIEPKLPTNALASELLMRDRGEEMESDFYDTGEMNKEYPLELAKMNADEIAIFERALNYDGE